MPRGASFLLIGGSLAAVSCNANHQLQVRPLGETHSKSALASGLLGEARAQLALGNVGLALESFRTLQRQQPEGADAYDGIADCYAVMGRYDLARTNYEFALAYAPNNPRLLQELAASLDHLGEGEQAVAVRAEAVRLATTQVESGSTQRPSITPMEVPRALTITIKLPEAHPRLSSARKIPEKATPPTPVMALATVMTPTARPGESATSSLRRRISPAPAVKPAAAAVAAGAMAVISVAAPRAPFAANTATPDSRPAPVPVHEQLAVEAPRQPSNLPTQQGPRLERQSRGAVLLITTPDHVQLAQADQRLMPHVDVQAQAAPTQRPMAPSHHAPLAFARARVEWVPLKGTEPRYVELLNAARTQGLAARARMALADRGWRKLAIGNAHEIRQHSLVLYGPTRLHAAVRLAAQFRCNAVKVAGMKSVVVLLGLDAAKRSSPSVRA